MSVTEHVSNITWQNNEETETIYELSEIASKVALQNFDWSYITFVFFNSTLWCGVELFLRTYEKAVVIGRGTFNPEFVRLTRQYVVFGISVTSIAQTLEWMRDHEFDNTGKYIIVCQSLDEYECDEDTAMKVFWKFKITNVLLLTNVDNNVTGFSYYPLDDNTCNYNNPVRLENLTLCLDALDFKENCNIFPTKLKHLNSCPLVVSTFIQTPYMKIENGIPSGADGDIVRLIAEKLNGSLKIMTPRIGNGWGKIDEDGTWSGSLADIYNDYANFSITSAALTLSRFSTFQLSIPYNYASVVWITHPAKLIPSSLKLTYPLQLDAQIALVVSFVFVIICSFIIRSRFWLRISRKIKTKRPRTGIVFYSWMICMGLPTTRLPTKTALLWIVLIWMWYCVLIRTFYQVSLITALKSNYYYQEFETIDDVIDAEYPFGGGAALKDYYIDYPPVYNQWTEVYTTEIIPTLRKVAQGMEFVLAMNMETAKIIIWTEKVHVHILPQKVVVCPTVVFFKKYSPLADAINYILVRLVESGISEKLYKDYANTPPHKKVGESLQSIKLEHYTGCYGILIAGWIASFLLLLAEIVLDKLCKNFNSLDLY